MGGASTASSDHSVGSVARDRVEDVVSAVIEICAAVDSSPSVGGHTGDFVSALSTGDVRAAGASAVVGDSTAAAGDRAEGNVWVTRNDSAAVPDCATFVGCPTGPAGALGCTRFLADDASLLGKQTNTNKKPTRKTTETANAITRPNMRFRESPNSDSPLVIRRVYLV